MKSHAYRQRLLNRLNFALEQLAKVMDRKGQANVDEKIWRREIEAINKELEKETT